MPLTPTARENLALNLTGQGTWISLHTGDPGNTGANEATGGSPAYARQQTTWTGGSVDGVVAGSQVSINTPAGTYAYFGVWTAATGGTFLGYGTFASVTTGGQSVIRVTPTYTQS